MSLVTTFDVFGPWYVPFKVALYITKNRPPATHRRVYLPVNSPPVFKSINLFTDAVLMSLLLTLSRSHTFFWCFRCDFEELNADSYYFFPSALNNH